MKNVLLFLGLATCWVACTNQEKQSPLTHHIKIVEAKGYVVPKDSMATPRVISIKQLQLKKIPVGKPSIVATNTNVHQVGAPKVVVAGKPLVCTPGKGSFRLPKVVLAIHKPVVAKHPKPVEALPPRVKDAATAHFQYLDVDQGMNSSYILSILEDKHGNLWFGTIGGGVTKYDGKHFTRYANKEGLLSNDVISIMEDKHGNLWFGTIYGGATKYDGTYFTHYTDKEGMSSNVILAIIEDKKDNIWFATLGGGITKYDGTHFTHYTDKEGLLNNDVRSMIEDKAGNIWLGAYDRGITKYDGQSFTHYTDKSGMNSTDISSILEDKSGNIWFGTYSQGIIKYDGKQFAYYTDKEGLSGNDIRSILQDKYGHIWFGTNGKGITEYDGENFTHHTDKQGLSNNYVASAIEDNAGNLWIGTDGGGVTKYNNQSFKHYTEQEGLKNNYVLSMIEDKKGNLWIGTSEGGLAKYNGKCFTHYTDQQGLNSNDVKSVLEDKAGNLWIGTNEGGLVKYDGSNFTYHIDKELLSSNTVRAILEDKTGNLWFGTDGGGVIKYNGKSFTYYTEKEGLSSNNVRTILEDHAGNFWFGTYGGGITKYDGKYFTHYTDRQGLSSNDVLSILEDKNKNLWFGTNGGGLVKYDGKDFTCYTDKEGLSNNDIRSILEDKVNHRLYVATEKGLNTIDLAAIHSPNSVLSFPDDSINMLIRTYHKEDGLKTEDFLRNNALIDSKGRAWWGTGKALSTLDLTAHKKWDKEPTIQLNGIDLQENFVDYSALKNPLQDSTVLDKTFRKITFSGVADFYNYPKNLELPHHLNHLTFCFSAIDWAAPHKIQYQYTLDGLDANWSKLTADNKADYRNIPYGHYTFKVRAIGIANKWSQTFEYRFSIHPPWWHTWWFRVIMILAFFYLAWLFIKQRERKIKQRQKELEAKIDEATFEIKHQKHIIEEKHKEITDSINYAERIQRSFLATEEILNTHLSAHSSHGKNHPQTGSNYFIFFKPKNVVSGDFYFASPLSNGQFLLATADSTGHGVPGAIMSILNITCLEKAIEEGLTNPAEILNYTRIQIIERLKKDGSAEGGKDGMDCSLTVYDFKNKKLVVASAHSHVWVVRNVLDSSSKLPNVIEIKPDKMPVGKHENQTISFKQHEVDLQKGDVIYTLTDGFSDQFGGRKGKKFMSKKLLQLLATHAHLPMDEQKTLFEKIFLDWLGDLEQIDDVTLIGVRI